MPQYRVLYFLKSGRPITGPLVSARTMGEAIARPTSSLKQPDDVLHFPEGDDAELIIPVSSIDYIRVEQQFEMIPDGAGGQTRGNPLP